MSTLQRTLWNFALAALILAATCLLRADAGGLEGGKNLATADAARLVAMQKEIAGAAVATVVDRATEQPAPTPFTREHLLATLARDLSSHFNLEGELQIELLRAWTPPSRVATTWTLQVLDYPSVMSSSLLLRARILADAAPAGEATFVLRANLWRDAWTTRQPLTIGATFDAAALEARRVDMLRERDALPAAVGDRSYIFARGVAAGRLLTWRDISRRPLIKKNDIVEVSAVDGLLALTMKAQAMENGAQGDTITVRNLESRKDFAATVIDENRVQVRF